SQSAGGESICSATGDIARQAVLLQCNVPWSDLGWPTPHWGGALAPSRTMRVRRRISVAVRAQLLRYPALFQAALRQPGVGALNGALDMIGRAREVVGRSHQRT